MVDIYGSPQALTGDEIVTIHQMQNGQLAKCTMLLSQLSSIINITSWAVGLPTVLPSAHGVLWNNNGVVSLS